MRVGGLAVGRCRPRIDLAGSGEAAEADPEAHEVARVAMCPVLPIYSRRPQNRGSQYPTEAHSKDRGTGVGETPWRFESSHPNRIERPANSELFCFLGAFGRGVELTAR